MALETKCQENARAIAQQMKNSGGSGSDVTVTQVLTSGTKIASIKVDDNTTDLYCETVPATPDAGDIAYDNTTSGLTATNVQDAIDEVAQGGGGAGAWTLVGTETGTNPIAIPAGAKELYIVASDGSVSSTTYLLVDSLSATSQTFFDGYYGSANNYGDIRIAATNTSVNINRLMTDAGDHTNSATIKLYSK